MQRIVCILGEFIIMFLCTLECKTAFVSQCCKFQWYCKGSAEGLVEHKLIKSTQKYKMRREKTYRKKSKCFANF